MNQFNQRELVALAGALTVAITLLNEKGCDEVALVYRKLFDKIEGMLAFKKEPLH